MCTKKFMKNVYREKTMHGFENYLHQKNYILIPSSITFLSYLNNSMLNFRRQYRYTLYCVLGIALININYFDV